MTIKDSLKQRRSYYSINKSLPMEAIKIIEDIQEITTLIPDAFNMKSSRIVIALNKKQDILWDTIYTAFNGAISEEKINSFKAGAGTILYFYDQDVITKMQEQFPTYAANFPIWAMQSSGMLQLSIWTNLREKGIGASLQHYNPVIDQAISSLFDLPDNYILVAQMPFGGIIEEPEQKEAEDISMRVKIFGL